MDSPGDVNHYSPFTVSLPGDVFTSLFEEIEPITRADGRVLKRYRMRLTGQILTEDPMDQMLAYDLIQVTPLPKPASLVFYEKKDV